MTRITVGGLDVMRFEPGHAVGMDLRSHDAEWASRLGAPLADQARLLACGPSVALLRGAEVVACGGVMVLWRDVAEAWMRTSPLVEAYPLALVKTVRWFLGSVWRDLALKRMQCTVRADYGRATRFAERVGFCREALLHRYGPEGADYIMYARVA
jgi:hypothetical protein